MLLNNVSLVVSIIFGAVSANMAKKQGKNPYTWFVVGALFGIFGLMFLYFSPKKRQGGSQTPKKDPNTIDITPKVSTEHQNKLWYYLDPDNTQNGPMSFDALSKAWQNGKVTKKTFVWNETLDNWLPFGDILQSPS